MAFTIAGAIAVQNETGTGMGAPAPVTTAGWSSWGAERVTMACTWLRDACPTVPTSLPKNAPKTRDRSVCSCRRVNMCALLAYLARWFYPSCQKNDPHSWLAGWSQLGGLRVACAYDCACVALSSLQRRPALLVIFEQGEMRLIDACMQQQNSCCAPCCTAGERTFANCHKRPPTQHSVPQVYICKIPPTATHDRGPSSPLLLRAYYCSTCSMADGAWGPRPWPKWSVD